MAKIAILGFGTVGSGVYEVLCRNAAGVSRRAGEPVEVKYILDPKDFSAHPAANLFIKNFDTILEDPEIRVVVETIGGTRFAYPYVKACLESGRSVCTSNKEMVATYGAELLALAKAHNCAFLFEASVGGGTPIITPMHQCLAANVITEVEGIVNGTTNFILENAPEDRTVDLLTEQLAVSIFGTSGDVGAITSDNILVTVDLADFGSAVGTYTVPAEVTVVGHDVGVSGGTYQVRVTISEQTSDQPAEPDTPAGEIPDTGDETT